VEIIGIRSGEFAAGFDRSLVAGTADQVDGEVPDNGHVFGAMADPYAGLVLLELDIEHGISQMPLLPGGILES